MARILQRFSAQDGAFARPYSVESDDPAPLGYPTGWFWVADLRDLKPGTANAGVSRDGLIEQLEPEDWDTMVSTNLTGTFLCTRAAVPHLRERGGVIINMSSSMATRIAKGAAGYSATKAAIEMFTKTSAIELGR